VVTALDGVFVARSRGGEREIPASEFFVDYLTSALAPEELLLGVRVPKLGDGWGFHYEKFHRTAQAWAIVGVACGVRRSNGSVTEARVAFTNMGPAPVRASSVESAVVGGPVSADAFREACRGAADGATPGDDLHGSADYRRHLAEVLTARALASAAGV
jgi:carbon-monoxide dehydrogenase medium subunit